MKRMVILITIALGFFVVALPGATYASPSNFAAASADKEACQAIGDINPEAASCQGGAGRSVEGLIRVAVQLLSVVAGVIAVIMLIVAGLKYVTSQGDAAQLTSARNALVYALVGVVVVMASQFLVQFVLKRIT